MKHISLAELRQMKNQEGLVLQGCGGDLTEWKNGINELLAERGILLGDSRFENISVFEHDGHTNLLFHMDDSVKLNVGKLAMWRLESRETFGGMWLSDFLTIKLDVDIGQQTQPETKPDSPIIGADSNYSEHVIIPTLEL